MIPRTVQAAKAVAATFSSSQLKNYGNIILNGFATTGANTVNKKAWQYKETAGAPINLPSLTSYQPILLGWSTNYMEYYTQLPPNGYNVNPGDPTMFEYVVHSFTAAQGAIASIGSLQGGSGYQPGTYNNVPTTSGTGTGATLNITVGNGGVVTSVTLVSAGSNYAVGDGLAINATAFPGLQTGQGFAVFVVTITPATTANRPKWAQCPRRFNQLQVSATGPNPAINYPQAIQYSWIYPIADSTVEPPIGHL